MIPDLSGWGWGTAAAALAALALAATLHALQSKRKLARELEDAEKDYRKAVESGDPDRIRIAGRDLRRLRKRAGREA